jgi:hypothetical protein
MSNLTPRYFIVFRDEAQLLNSNFGNWIDPVRGAHFNEFTIIDGEEEDDQNFWHILSSKRDSSRGQSSKEIRTMRTQVFSKIMLEEALSEQKED